MKGRRTRAAVCLWGLLFATSSEATVTGIDAGGITGPTTPTLSARCGNTGCLWTRYISEREFLDVGWVTAATVPPEVLLVDKLAVSQVAPARTSSGAWACARRSLRMPDAPQARSTETIAGEPVLEPDTLLLLGVGSMAIAMRRRNVAWAGAVQ